MIFQDVESVAGRLAVFDRHVAAERPRIDEFADQVDRRAIVPVKFFAPAADFLLEQRLRGSASVFAEGRRSAWSADTCLRCIITVRSGSNPTRASCLKYYCMDANAGEGLVGKLC